MSEPGDRPGGGIPADPTVAVGKTAPTAAERCRTLSAEALTATLSTTARDPAGFPYGSLVAVAADGEGRMLLLLSSLAEHTQNLAAHPEASLLVAERAPAGVDPLSRGRHTLLGRCVALPAGDERAAARAIFCAAHPEASRYADFKDFSFYRLTPIAVRYIGGFGRMSWVSDEEYRLAEPDPLRADAAAILGHMNDDHAAATLDYARALCRIPEATAARMTAVDRYGFDLEAVTSGGIKVARLGFPAPVSTSEAVRSAMVAMVKQARALLAP